MESIAVVEGILKGWRPWLLLVLLCAALYGPGLAPLPATDRDESRYMQATRQMVETGDVVRIRFMHEARNKKPVGVYWAQAAAVSTFSDAGSTARWPYRLPSAIGAALAVLLLFAAGQALFDRRTGFLAAALLAPTFLLVWEAHIAKTDAVLLATVMGAMAPLAAIHRRLCDSRPTGNGLAAAFWISLGIGILVKGPLTPLVAGLTVFGLAWFTAHGRGLIAALKPLWGVPLALAIAAPWFVAIIFADPDFVRESAGHDFFKKLISFQENHGGPPGYYLLLAIVTLAPAVLFLPPAAAHAWRYRREPAIAFCLFWLVPFWLILEIVPTKLPHYLLPAYPALALLIARAALSVEEGLTRQATRRWAYLWYTLCLAGVVIAAAAFPSFVQRLGGTPHWTAYLPFAAAVATLPLTIRYLRSGRIRQALLLSAFAAPLYFGPLYASVLPGARDIWPSREIAAAVARAAPDRATRPPVIATGYREPSLVFYLGTSTTFDEPGVAVQRLATMPRWLAVVAADKRDEFEAAAARANLAFRRGETVRGFNYSRGRREEVTLYASTR